MLDIIYLEPDKRSEVFETQFSYNSCKDISRQLIQTAHRIGTWVNWISSNGNTISSEVIQKIKTFRADSILIVSEPETIISAHAITAMKKGIQKGYPFCVPVYNETSVRLQQVDLSHPYINVSTYVEISELFFNAGSEFVKLNKNTQISIDTSCVLVDRIFFQKQMSFFEKYNGSIPHLNQLISMMLEFNATQKEFVVCRNALVHRFGDYYSGDREILVDKVPDNAKDVLDIGTARGGFGKRLKQKKKNIHVSGIELNASMAREARLFYDEFYEIDATLADFDAAFDHINCGEVIEHVYDPWTLIAQMYKALRPGGTICLSVPNAGHWSVVKELLNGHFNYITIGLQCVTHIRWFTEFSITNLLENAGFVIQEIERMEIPPTPEGVKFIRRMCDLDYASRKDLMTFDMILTATKKSES